MGRRFETVSRKTALAALIFAALLLQGQSTFPDPKEEFRLLLEWKKPGNYPPPLLEGMDVDTLSTLLDSGNLQWYEPRPTAEKWEGVVGMKIHAPPEVVWDVITDYELQCEILPDTFLECKTEHRNGNEVGNRYKLQTTVIMYDYIFDMIDQVREDPPCHLHINTVEGGLKGRELDLKLVPVDNGAHTLFFMRYFAEAGGLGIAIKLAVTVLPMIEPPTAVGAANYHSRAYKNEAERRVGYKPSAKPLPLKFDNLDLATLRIIDQRNGGIIRETPDGRIIDALTFDFIDAPPDKVYAMIVDFDKYEKIYPGGSIEVESRKGNEIIVYQKTTPLKIFIFEFMAIEMHSRYTLDPPYHASYVAIDGKYEGSHGDFRIVPLEGGNKSLVFVSAGVNLERDEGLFSRIAQSGAFPLENMLNMMGAQSALAHLRGEAERAD